MKQFLIIAIIAFSIQPAFCQSGNTGAKRQAEGDSLFLNANYEAAIQKYNEAVDLYSKKNTGKEYFYCRNRIAECLSREGKYDKALEISEALNVGDANPAAAEIYNTRGFIFLNKGRSDLAMEYFNKALTLYNNSGQRESAGVAACLNNIGLAYWTTGNKIQAIDYLEQALRIRKKLYNENNTDVAASYNNIGLVYSQDDTEKAAMYYQTALDIYTKIYNANHPSIAIAYNNLGIISRKQSKYDASIDNFYKALDIWRANFGENHPNVAFVYNNMGQTYFEKGDNILAKSYFEKGLANYIKNYGEKHPEVAYTYTMLAQLDLKEEKYNACLDKLQSALLSNSISFSSGETYSNPRYNDYYNANLMLSTLVLKAQALEKRYYNKTLKEKDLTFALSCMETGDSLIDRIRQVLQNKNDKIALGRTSSMVYENAIRLAYAISLVTPKTVYYQKKAFYFSEENKAAVLLEAISDANAKSFAHIPDSLVEKEKAYTSDIAYYEQKLAQGPTAEEDKKLREKLFNLNREYAAFISRLEKSFPEYFNLKYNIQTASVEDVQAVLSADAAMVSYFISEESKRLYVFYITQKTFKAYNVPLLGDLDRQITGLRNSIKLQSVNTFKKTAYALHKQLFPFTVSGKIEKLIVIPDGRLGVIPFECLLTEKPAETQTDFKGLQYAILKHAFCYNYSSTLFIQNVKGENSFSQMKSSIFLCAPVEFSENLELATLSGTEREVAEIGKLFSEKNCIAKPFTHEAASESIIKSDEPEKYKYLHLATHGIVNEEQPELSEIFLSPDAANNEDGNLYAGEIYNLKIKADLVTLSACQTGLGKVSKGEGIVGLSRALMYAGAENIIVSLWSVSDESTAQLMISFYSNLINNAQSGNYETALRDAKLKLIQSENFNAPYYWAPFILIGY